MSLRDRTSNSNSIALRPRTSLITTIAVRQLRSQYDYLVFGTMALRLISGRDGFSNFLSRFKILTGHLDQTRPNSSNNVRK